MEAEQLYQIFLEEAEELCSTIETSLLQLEKDATDKENIYELFRAFHSLKGSAGIVGFQLLSDFAHVSEDLLEKIHEGKLSIQTDLISLLLKTNDKIREILTAGKDRAAETVSGLDDIQAQLLSFSGGKKSTAIPIEQHTATQIENAENSLKYYQILLDLRPDIFSSGQDPILLIWELRQLGKFIYFNVDDTKLPDLTNMDATLFYLRWQLILETRASEREIDEVFIFIKEDNPIQLENVTAQVEQRGKNNLAALFFSQAIELNNNETTEEQQVQNREKEKEQKKEAYATSSIRVNTDKIETMMNLIEETAIGFSRLTQNLKKVAPVTYIDLTANIESVLQNLQDLQEQVMRMRMIPVGSLFQRYKRLVRDLALKQNKEISLHLEGTNTELDKDMLESLSDPIKHLLRNAIDHGLEPGKERRQHGKTEQGNLTLSAYQQSGRVFIEIKDDGRGIDMERIKEKSIEKGWLDAEENVSQQQLFHFLLLPGFSTSEQVTDVSGRGVGLDVVHQAIIDLNGSLQIKTEPGSGTTFRLAIPLTLAIIDGMLVQIGKERWIIPMQNVLKSIHIPAGMLETIEGRERMYWYKDEYIPVYRLDDFFPSYKGKKNSKPESHLLFIILDSGVKHFALEVDSILGNQQVAIKNLDQNYKRIAGATGATILEDGQIALILDPFSLTTEITTTTLSAE